MKPLIFNELHLGSFFFHHFIAFNCIGMRSFSSYFNDVVQWLSKNYKLMIFLSIMVVIYHLFAIFAKNIEYELG